MNVIIFNEWKILVRNRSIVYDPTDPNGKDKVNTVKGREWFRPFAGSIMKEHAKEWFDLRGICLLYTSPSPRDATLSRMPSSA